MLCCLVDPTNCDATSADSVQYWYASKTNSNGIMESNTIGLIIYCSPVLRHRRRCALKLLLSCRLQTTQYTPNAAQTCVKVHVEHCEHVPFREL